MIFKLREATIRRNWPVGENSNYTMKRKKGEKLREKKTCYGKHEISSNTYI